MLSIEAINNVVIDLYNTTWNKAFNALNSSGLLYDMEILDAALNSNSSDPSIANATIDQTTSNNVNAWFLNYLTSDFVDLPTDTDWTIDVTIQDNATTGIDVPVPSGSMASGIGSSTGLSGSYGQSQGYSMTYGFQT